MATMFSMENKTQISTADLHQILRREFAHLKAPASQYRPRDLCDTLS